MCGNGEAGEGRGDSSAISTDYGDAWGGMDFSNFNGEDGSGGGSDLVGRDTDYGLRNPGPAQYGNDVAGALDPGKYADYLKNFGQVQGLAKTGTGLIPGAGKLVGILAGLAKPKDQIGYAMNQLDKLYDGRSTKSEIDDRGNTGRRGGGIVRNIAGPGGITNPYKEIMPMIQGAGGPGAGYRGTSIQPGAMYDPKDLLTIMANETYGNTAQARDLINRRGLDFMQGNFDPSTSPAWAPTKNMAEQQYSSAKQDIMGNTPKGGALLRELSGANMDKARTMVNQSGNIAQDEYNKIFGLATGAGTTAAGILNPAVAANTALSGQASSSASAAAALEFQKKLAEQQMWSTIGETAGSYFGSK
jgi:hypothetical protein